MSFTFRDNIEKLVGYVPGFQPVGAAVVKLNTNENPYPPSPAVFEALAGLDVESLRRYPPVLWDGFRRAAAELHHVDPEMIIAGNGGDELLTMLIRCCCDPGRALAYPVPTYSLYSVLATIQDCPTVEIPFGPAGHLPDGLAETGAAVTILCNPNAPTGGFVSPDEVGRLAESVAGVLAVDEAYVDFAEDNCLRLLEQHENVVILRSMSKGYSLAGLRFGYAIAPVRISGAMIKVKDSYNVNIATQIAATAALQDRDWFSQNVRKVIDQRQRLINELAGLGFEVGPSHANFLLARTTTPSAQEIYEKLTLRHIYVRYFEQQGLKDHLRITVGTAAQNDALLAALGEIVL